MRRLFRHDSDSPEWVGYADFMTTLAVLFLAVGIGYSLVQRSFLRVVVIRPPTEVGQVSCETGWVELQDSVEAFGTQPTFVRMRPADDTIQTRTFRLSGLGGTQKHTRVFVRCRPGGDERDTTATVHFSSATDPDTITGMEVVFDFRTRGSVESPEGGEGIVFASLSGGAIFERNESELKEGAEERIQQLVKTFQLDDGDVLAIQGHSDDSQFESDGGRSFLDNWYVSALRAASVARALTDPRNGDKVLNECQVVVMAFGPSRPVRPVDAADPPEVRRTKRAANRRVEFRKLSGEGLTETLALCQ